MDELVLATEVRGAAEVSPCGTYRYWLTRKWSGAGPLVFVMLNPSTADALADDATIRRCMGFARAMGLGGIHVVNLFAFRATDPKDLLSAADPVGPHSERCIRDAARVARRHRAPVVCAWGANGSIRGRDREVLAILASERVKPSCLAITKRGAPGHPLCLSADLRPVPFEVPRG